MDSSVSPLTAEPGGRGRDQDRHVLRRKAKKGKLYSNTQAGHFRIV